MLPATEAENLILDLVTPLDAQRDTEVVSLSEATGRILATAIAGKLDFPYWDNSAMDGYAVQFADVRDCSSQQTVMLEIVAEIPAGREPDIEIKSGQAARIFTGAMLPSGADTIVIQENTQRHGERVEILSAPQFEEFVRHRGAFYRAETPMLEAGVKLGAPDIAVLATAQATNPSVYRRPRVAILSTGDELILPDRPLKPGQIIDSNQYALASFVTSNGGIPVNLGIVGDRPEALKDAISQAISSADMVLSTGGVSVGDYDYVERILTELGGELHIRSVAVKPGKPLTVAKFTRCLYFGIPGNPVSALVSCWRFVQPALLKLSGLKEDYRPVFLQARTRHQLSSGGKRETYFWGKLSLTAGEYEFALAGGSHSSGNLINLAQTNALAIVPVGQKAIAANEMVKVIQITR